MDGDDLIATPIGCGGRWSFFKNTMKSHLVSGATVVFGHEGKAIGLRRGPWEHKQIRAGPESRFPLAHAGWLGRTDWFRRHPYREDAVRIEDWTSCSVLSGKAGFANLREIVLGCNEASLSLRKIALARWHHSRLVIEYAQTGRATLNALAEVGMQAAKLMLDAFALGTGLNHRLLKHRVPPISRDEIETWRAVSQAAHETASQCLEDLESVPA